MINVQTFIQIWIFRGISLKLKSEIIHIVFDVPFLARGHRPAAGYRSTKVVVLLVLLLVVVGAYRDQPYPLI